MTALFVILSPIFSQCLESKVNSMRTSQYLFSTLKETPAEAAIVSHQLMLRAGMSAPSGKDVRPWEFVVVSDRAKLDSMAAALPYAKMLTQARNAIIVCGDSARSFYWYLDCSAAAQNILLAAESMGLGAVWTAAYPYEDRMQVVRKYTNLPDNILPLCVIPFGYPATKENPKQKFDEKKIHYNQY